MTRVSEASSFHAINHAVGKTKSRLEDIQLKGSNLKRIQKPSDDPIGNTELLAVRSVDIDNQQYLRNISFGKAQLAFIENAIEELTDLTVKAKELAIGQASNFYDSDIRKSVAKEIGQIKKQMISIGNRRMGNKYVFGGHKTLTRPFDEKGNYFGDDKRTQIEVSKDFFVPISIPGKDVFFSKEARNELSNPEPVLPPQIQNQNELDTNEIQINRNLASQVDEQQQSSALQTGENIIKHINSLENALITNNPEIIQTLLPVLDQDMNNLIELRTSIGSTINSIENAENNIEKTKLLNAEYKTKIEDADVAELFTDLTRQQNTLNATYKASSQLMNRSLLDFLG
jgi:flagellar hook-associated protein 3 FlgL